MNTLLIMLAAVVCIGYLISPLAGFSTLQILSRRIDSRYHHTSSTIPSTSYCNTQRLSNHYNDRELSQYWRIVQRTSTCTYAVFQDDDCEDLCDDFGEDFKPPSHKKKEVVESSYLPPPTNTKDTSIECEDLCEDLDTDDFSAPSTTYQVASIKKPTKEKSKSKALWWVDEEGLDTCKTCNGSGKCTCRFCGGTTFLSGVGGDTDALFVEGIGKDCPVCDDGLETCHECAGTGYIFSWSPPEEHKNHSLHP